MAREALAEPVGPVVLADPVVLAALVAPVVQVGLVVQEDPAVVVALVVQEDPAVLVGLEHVQVEAVLEHAQAAVEQERDLAEAAPEHGPVAVPPRTKSVIAAHHLDQVPLLAAVVDLVAVAQTMREQAAAEAVIAWEVAVTVAAEAEAVINPPTSFTMPAAVTMSVSRFISYGQLRSKENLLPSCGAGT